MNYNQRSKDKHNLNLSIDLDTYQKIKSSVPSRKVSPLVNNLLKEHLKKIKQERLVASYKKTAQSKAVKKEDKIWEDAVADGMDK